MEGEGAYTRSTASSSHRPGDFVVTPGWSWPRPRQSRHRGRGVAGRSGHGVRQSPRRATSARTIRGPQPRRDPKALGSVYPYERTRGLLEKLSRAGGPTPSHGLEAALIRIPPPERILSRPWCVHAAACRKDSGPAAAAPDGRGVLRREGRGRADIGGSARLRAITSPSSCRHGGPPLHGAADCVIFSYSDRARAGSARFCGKKADTRRGLSHPPLDVGVDEVRSAVHVVEDLGHAEMPRAVADAQPE